MSNGLLEQFYIYYWVIQNPSRTLSHKDCVRTHYGYADRESLVKLKSSESTGRKGLYHIDCYTKQNFINTTQD